MSKVKALLPVVSGFLAAVLSVSSPSVRAQPDSVVEPETVQVESGTGAQAPGLPDAVAPSSPTGASEAESAGSESQAGVEAVAEPEPEVFELLGTVIEPGQWRRLRWQAHYGFGELDASSPVIVARGRKPGLTLCLTAAVHGDELNGIEIVRRVMQGVETDSLSGVVIGVPIVNLPGFQRGSRYLPDRRDLNRFFPGSAGGSLAARIAEDFFTKIIAHCDRLVDIHTGSFARTNLPQLRADLRVPEIVEMTRGFGDIAVVHKPGAAGTLRRSANRAGIPTVTLEVGEPDRLQTHEVSRGVKGIESLMSRLGMTPKEFVWREPQPIFYESRWVRVEQGGILFTQARLGDEVKVGDLLGTVTDPLSNVRHEVLAPRAGRVLGKALNQFVMPGFAAFRLGIKTSEDQVAAEPEPEAPEALESPLLDEADEKEAN